MASDGDEGCSSAISLVMTIAAMVSIPKIITPYVKYILSAVGCAVGVALCVSIGDVSRRSSIAS